MRKHLVTVKRVFLALWENTFNHSTSAGFVFGAGFSVVVLFVVGVTAFEQETIVVSQ